MYQRAASDAGMNCKTRGMSLYHWLGLGLSPPCPSLHVDFHSCTEGIDCVPHISGTLSGLWIKVWGRVSSVVHFGYVGTYTGFVAELPSLHEGMSSFDEVDKRTGCHSLFKSKDR